MTENSTHKLFSNDYLVLARRYRPQSFRDVLGHDAVMKTLQHAILSQKIAHAYLFSGPRGTGKTTIARLFAKALNCPSRKEGSEPCNECASCREITESRSLDVQEIDGASHRGIDNIRAVTEAAAYAPTSSPYKLYIIDEAHMLTKEAWNALLKTLEEPPPSVKFFFATTEPHKIPSTIVSRCQRFNLRRISHAQIVTKLQKISRDLGILVDDAALLRLADYADGAFRDAESLFDQLITFSEGSLTENMLEEVLGIAPFDWFLELDGAIFTADVSVAYKISDRVFHDGKDIGHFVDDLCEHFKTLLLLKLAIPLPTEVPEGRKIQMAKIAKDISQEHLIDVLSLLSDTQKSLGTTSSERFLLEWLLISIVRITRKVPLPLIVRKLFELQEMVQQKVHPNDLKNREFANAESPGFDSDPREKPREKQKEVEESPLEAKQAPLSHSVQEEATRQENLLRFASVELGAQLIQKPK